MFFSGFPRMVGLSFFPALRQLTIVGQSIKRIEALDCCPLLEELWVAECHLTVRLFICLVFSISSKEKIHIWPFLILSYFLQEISGLQNCCELVKLYLYDNQIREIKNLTLQTNLEVLWLNNNCINKIQVWTLILLIFYICILSVSIDKQIIMGSWPVVFFLLLMFSVCLRF